jgi:hypothetical protein
MRLMTYMEPKEYISLERPRMVIADMKLTTREKATGTSDMLPSARRYS